MKDSLLAILGTVLPTLVAAQGAQNGVPGVAPERGPYARIAFLRPHDGQTVDFEAGYIRHLDWHRQNKDPFVWYGWSIWAGERQRWFVYASFGHSAADFDHAVAPAEDERDNVLNVVPHAEFTGNGLYVFLPALSRGTGEPQPAARVELTTVDLVPGAAKAFEAGMSSGQPPLTGETLWYRMVAGGSSPRYLRLRPRQSLSAILESESEQTLPRSLDPSIVKTTVEILTLRPAMSYNLPPPGRQ